MRPRPWIPLFTCCLLLLTTSLLPAPLAPPQRSIALAAPLGPSDNFTIVVLPDTQLYSLIHPRFFYNQTRWIVSHKDALHVVYVAQEGDLVQTAASTLQWLRASLAMLLLQSPRHTQQPDGIPYSVLPGNHDHPTTNYNRYFGAWRFATKDYYGGHYDDTNNDSYVLFTAAGLDFIAVSLEYNPNAAELDWADGLLQTYASRRAILITHDLLALDASWDPAGQRVYDALKDHPNLFLMLCGHNHGEAQRTDAYNGTTLTTLLADYQSYPHGGDGYLRILQFCPAANEIRVTTYSPALDQYETDNDSQFTISYTMAVP